METPRLRARVIGKFTPPLVLGAGLVTWTVMFVQHARGLWFTGDDFDYLLHRSVSLGGDHGLLVPHNEHWSTIPILLFRLNYAIFGLHHYLPYALLPIGCHVLVCVLLYTLLRLSDVTQWVAVLSTLVAAFTIGAAGAENTLWDFQVGFLGSCVFGLVALVLFASGLGNRTGRVAGVLALVLSLMSSGMGIPMVLWSGAFLLIRDGVRTAVATISLPAVVYLGWYAKYGHGHTGGSPVKLTVAPLAAMRGMGYIWSTATGVPNAGPVLLAAMVAAVVIPRLSDRLFALAGSGLLTVVAAYALLGYGRSGFGVDATLRSRYVYFGLVFTLPALAAGFGLLAQALSRRPARVAAIAWLTAGAVVLGVGTAQASRSTSSQHRLVTDNRARLVAAARLVASGSPLLRTMPMPGRNPDVDVASLEKPSVRAALPDLDPGTRAQLNVAANLQVDVGSVTHSLPAPTDVRWRGFSALEKDGADPASCMTRRTAGAAFLEIPLDGVGTEFRLVVSGTGITTQLVSGSSSSEVVQWPTRPQESIYVASTASAASLRVQVPPGVATLCTG